MPQSKKAELLKSNFAWLLLLLLSIWAVNRKKADTGRDNGDLALQFTMLEKKVDKAAGQPEYLRFLRSWSEGTLIYDEACSSLLAEMQDQPFILGIVSDGRLKAWTGRISYGHIPPSYPDGWYLIDDSTFQKKISLDGASGPALIAQFSLGGKFTAAPPSAHDGTDYAIKTRDGKIIAYPLSKNIADGKHIIAWITPVYLLAYLALILSISALLRRQKGNIRPVRLLLIACMPVIFRITDLLAGIGQTIDQALVNAAISQKPVLSQWYGNWLLILVFYFLFVEYILEQIRPSRYLRKVRYASIKYTLLLFTLDYLGLVGLLIFCRELVINSGINFDFNNIFNLGIGPLFSIVILAILLFRYFVFAYKINLNLFRHNIDLGKKLAGMTGGFLLVLPLILLSGLNLPLFILVLVVLLFSLVFDMFIESRAPSLGWLVTWIFFFAAFATMSLFKFNRDKERDERLALIDHLKQKDDTTFLSHFSRLVLSLKNNRQFNTAFSRAIDSRNAPMAVDILQMAASNEEYIQNYYNIDFFITWRDSLIMTSKSGLESRLRAQNIRFEEGKTFLKAYQKDSYHAYWLKIYWQMADIRPSPEIYFAASKKLIVPQRNKGEPGTEFMRLKDLGKYDYAIYQNEALTESQGRIYPDHIRSTTIFGRDELVVETTDSKRSELAAHVSDNDVIIVGKNLMGIIKPVSLCSFLIVILLMLTIIVAFLNSRTKILPVELPLLISSQFNLRQRIEYSIILVIVTSFMIIAWVTGSYFRNLSFKMEENQLSNKTFAIVADVESRLGASGMDSLSEKSLRQIALAHQANFSLYDEDGAKRFDSSNNLKPGKSKAVYMPPVPFLHLFFGNEPVYFNLSDDGSSIREAYVPVRQGRGDQPAWLEVPYSEANMTSFFAASDLLGTLLNVYVFLLLVAGGLAFFVANSVTKPLVRLVENLRQIKLGKKNEQLQWDRQDEIGSLINEYNNMIGKLEESTDLLVKSEREGAWRDMAQQVAHEIKNPLTPMKLSIQYLERKIGTVPQEEMQQVIKDTARTVIEQIDNLASIATEFSNFAKMPAPVMEYINFNELVSSIHELFRKKDDIQFNLYVPIDDIIVLADRSHLLRVLNNLVQNAIQSIPPGRNGKIGLALKVEDSMAVLKVKDNGLGIPEDMFDKVFYPRFTTKNSGMGLGLAMCKSIVDSFGGTISFRSQINVGTEFEVRIPLPDRAETTVTDSEVIDE